MEAFRMMSMAYGSLVAQAVYVAAKLGLADLLADGPKDVDDLARATGAHAPSLRRLLRTLASLKVFTEERDGVFASTPLGATLQSDTPDSVRAAVIVAGDPILNTAYIEMLYSVRTGKPGFDRIHGAGFFDYLATHPETNSTFNAGMANFSEMENAAVAASYDFSRFGSVVDVGGGHGGFLAEVLKAHPTVNGVL